MSLASLARRAPVALILFALGAAVGHAAPGPRAPSQPANPKFVPSGAVVMFGGGTAPSGWLLCDGSEVSRNNHPELFAAIGTTYGEGDGETTFQLPDLRQRFPLGLAPSGTGAVLGEQGGEIDHSHDVSASTASAGSHAHGITANTASAGDHGHSVTGSAATAGSHGHAVSGTTATAGSHAHGVSGSTVAAGNHNHVVLIRAQGTDGGLLAGDGQRVLNANIGGTTMNQVVPGPLNAQDGILGVKGATGQQFGSSQAPDHAHSFSTTSGSAGDHSHGLSGTAAAGGDHGHSVSGTAANAGSHVHGLTATSDAAGGHGHALDATTASSNPAYLVLQFIIKE